MKVGRLDRSATLYANTPTRAADGSVVNAWAPVLRLQVSKDALGGTASRIADRTSGTFSTEFHARWSSLFRQNQQLHCEGVVYDITNVREVGRRQYALLECRSVPS